MVNLTYAAGKALEYGDPNLFYLGGISLLW